MKKISPLLFLFLANCGDNSSIAGEYSMTATPQSDSLACANAPAEPFKMTAKIIAKNEDESVLSMSLGDQSFSGVKVMELAKGNRGFFVNFDAEHLGSRGMIVWFGRFLPQKISSVYEFQKDASVAHPWFTCIVSYAFEGQKTADY